MAIVSSSLWEDPGAVMIEFILLSKTSNFSNCPNGPEEFLSYGKGGYLFSNNNLQELEQKLTKFLNDEEKKHNA